MTRLTSWLSALVCGAMLLWSVVSYAAQPETSEEDKPLLPSQPALGLFDGHSDVGPVKLAGQATYDAAQQTYEVAGAGTNMWFGQDEFHWAWKQLQGDFIVRTRAHFIGQGVEEHRKLGWVIRSTTEPDSPHVTAVVHGDGLTSLQFRRQAGEDTEEVKASITGADVIQLERKGDEYIMSVARFGEVFSRVQVSDVPLGQEVSVGLFVCSHNADVVEKAVFENVRIVRPAAADFVPYRDYIGSHLETLDIATGSRRVLHSSPKSLQAPNWTRDNKALIYNCEGRLYRFDLATNTPQVIDTGIALRHNNDHVLSWDGRQLGISHHSQDDDGQSIVYTVPVEGGTPSRVTALGPSYLHGWSPDDKFVIYTGGRDGQYDIYRIPVTGGDEIQLTNTPGLDDGSEYTPDGKSIYFNSDRTGSMELWRMDADGGNPKQITDDPLQNWFPHVAPDGKSIVFLSFEKEVKSNDHPFYKQVYLRAMPISGGAPKVIAYIYGGQGTINVPSWSPDGRHVAFVSNSDMP